MALQADGGIVTTGYAQFGSAYDFLTARYLGDPAPRSPATMLDRQQATANNIPDPVLVPLVLGDTDFMEALTGNKRNHSA